MPDYVIGIDIGGTNIRTGLVDERGTLSCFERESSRALLGGGAPIPELARHIADYRARHCAGKNVLAVSIGLPSSVSKDKSTLYSTPNLPGFDNLELKGPLEQATGLPVFMDRDTNFLLHNDIAELNLDPASIILGFYVGTGFGNAIYLEGTYYAGRHGAAGELGHIPLYGVEDVCTCGNKGCSETRCSGRYLEHLTEVHFPGTAVSQVFTNHGHEPVIRKFVRDLAVPMATEINLFDPDIGIIAGGVINMKDFPKDMLLEAVKEKVRRPYPALSLDLRFKEHTQQSGVLGGGRFAHEMLQKV